MAQELIRGFAGALLLLPAGADRFRHLLLYCDQPESLSTLLEAALSIATSEAVPLQVLLPSGSPDLTELRHLAQARVAADQVRAVTGWQPRHLMSLTDGEPCLLMMGRSAAEPLLTDPDLLRAGTACLLWPDRATQRPAG